jgi:hypothetical protein
MDCLDNQQENTSTSTPPANNNHNNNVDCTVHNTTCSNHPPVGNQDTHEHAMVNNEAPCAAPAEVNAGIMQATVHMMQS